jgi:hypothetical protein
MLSTTDYYIQEKIDGSQLTFRVIDGKPVFRCRGKEINESVLEFTKSTHMIKYRSNILNPNFTYHSESVTRPKHNILTYNRMPLYNCIIYDIYDNLENKFLWHDEMEQECNRIGFEFVPCLIVGTGPYVTIVREMVKSGLMSYLGGIAEGVVIKFRVRTQQVGSYKCVIDSFREDRLDEKKETGDYGQDGVLTKNLGLCFATEARFKKAIQHLKEGGIIPTVELLKNELDLDFDKDYEQTIKEILWAEFSYNIKKYARTGCNNFLE